MGNVQYTSGPASLSIGDNGGEMELLFFGAPILGDRLRCRMGKSGTRRTEPTVASGSDSLGEYRQISFTFTSINEPSQQADASIRMYDSFLLFSVVNRSPMTERESKHLFGHPYLSFPSFEGEEWQDGLSMLSFKRQAPFNYPEQWKGLVLDSPRDGKNTPLIATNAQFDTVIVSPLNHLLYNTVSIDTTLRAVRCGLPRALKEIPAGTVSQTLVVYGSGVNRTIRRYGELMRLAGGTERATRTADISLTHLSYWTNAGSAYWYNVPKQLTYEQTLQKLKNHHERIGLRIGLYQLDSWWYKKDGNRYTSSITEYEPRRMVVGKNYNSMLPFIQSFKRIDLFSSNRLSYVQSFLRKPIGTHFKQISNDSVYTEQFEFVKEAFAVPKDYANALAFFKRVFHHPYWRLSLIVHDWLNYLVMNHSAFEDLEQGPAYFRALDDALLATKAESNKCGHLTLQLCMALPSITLLSSGMSSVTSIRSTSDANSFLIEGPTRWRWHLYSSVLIQAMGKYAFFDNRFSYRSYLHPFSSWSRFEMIWLALGCGPIGLGDEMGKENVELLQRVVNTDGEILKPDEPCVPLDQCYLDNPNARRTQKGVTVYTSSLIAGMEREQQGGGLGGSAGSTVEGSVGGSNQGIGGDTGSGAGAGYRVWYVLSFNCHPFWREVYVSFSLSELDELEAGEYALYDYGSQQVIRTGDRQLHHMRLKGREFRYQLAAPVVAGRAFFGDVSKHVSASGQIVRSAVLTADDMSLRLAYTPDSECRLAIYTPDRPATVLFGGAEIPERKGRSGMGWTYSASNGLLFISMEGIAEGEYDVRVLFVPLSLSKSSSP